MLSSVQRATNTSASDWKVTHKDVDEWIRDGHERVAKGDRWAMVAVLYGNTFKEGMADRFHGRESTSGVLGLREEDVDEVVRRVVERVEKGSK